MTLFYRNEKPSSEFLSDFDEWDTSFWEDKDDRFLRIHNSEYFLVRDSLHAPRPIRIICNFDEQQTLVSLEHLYSARAEGYSTSEENRSESTLLRYTPQITLTGEISLNTFCDFSAETWLLHTRFADIGEYRGPFDGPFGINPEEQKFEGEFEETDLSLLTKQSIPVKISITVSDGSKRTTSLWYERDEGKYELIIKTDSDTIEHLITKLESGAFDALVTNIYFAEWHLVKAGFEGGITDLADHLNYLIPSLTSIEDRNRVSIELCRAEPLWGQFRTEIPTTEEKISFLVSRAATKISDRANIVIGLLVGILGAVFMSNYF